MALREAEKRCQLLLDSSVDAIAYVHDGMHIYANRTYLELFGYEDVEELEGMPMIDLIASCDQVNFKDFLKTYQSLEGSAELVCGGVRADGSDFRARIHFSPAAYDGEPCIQVVIRTESDNAELEEKLREISSQDLVTGLYNRNRFLELLDSAVERAVNAGQLATLAYIRVDRFASLQAELGLADADLLLADLSELLRQHFPADTPLARFGDDVFAALQQGVAPGVAEETLAALLKKVEGHLFEIDGRTVQTTLTIGVAGLDEKTAQAREVVDRAHRCADELTEGNALKRYNPADELAAAANRGSVVAMVRQALENNSFRLLFQPIISLRGDTHEHYEVLLRLLNPQGEEVPPTDFINAAKEAGLAAKIDRWVLLNSIKLLAEHRAKGHSTRLFLHLSSASLQDPSLLPWLSVALKAARLPSDSLVIQLAEPDAIAYLKQAKRWRKGWPNCAARWPSASSLRAEPVQHAAPPAGRLRQGRWFLHPGPRPGGEPGSPQDDARQPARPGDPDHRSLRRERQRAGDAVAGRGELHPGPLPAGPQPVDGLRLRFRQRMNPRAVLLRRGYPLIEIRPPARG